MTHEELKQATLDQSTEGRDIANWRTEARALLSDLMDQTPPLANATVLPVARRLLAYPDWRETLTVQSVLDFCVAGSSPRYVTVLGLAALRTDDYDPEVEHLMGMVESYRDAIGGPTILPCRPDLAVPAPREPDYLAIARSFG